jgi:alpha-beta hydrolase superfamily lysophospholipase
MIHEEGTISSADNTGLYYQLWKPRTQPCALIVILHGLFEHGGRYRKLAEYLAAQGYIVCAPDLRGHGLSQGKRVWVSSFSDYIFDAEALMGHLGKAAGDLRFLCWDTAWVL